MRRLKLAITPELAGIKADTLLKRRLEPQLQEVAPEGPAAVAAE